MLAIVSEKGLSQPGFQKKLRVFSQKIRIFRLDKRAVYSTNARIQHDDKIFILQIFSEGFRDKTY